MSEEKDKTGKAVAEARSTVPTSVPLGPGTSVDLSWLPEDERTTLLTEYARGILDISRKAQDLGVDVEVLRKTLETLTDTVKEATKAGAHATVTHTQETGIGRTETIIGDSREAERGRLTSSQTGQRDWTPYYIIGGLLAVVLIAALLGR